MESDPRVLERIERIFDRALDIEPPGAGVDLIAAGVLDSFAVLELLAELEAEFQAAIPLEQLEIDDFRTLDAIAALVERCRAAATAPAVRSPPL
jgi:acyl carrier protein